MKENYSLREEVKLEIRALSCPVIENQSAVNAVQNSLMDLKISSTKPVDRVDHPEQDSKSKVQGFPKTIPPIKILDVDTLNVFKSKPSTKEIFYPSGYNYNYTQRRATSRHVSIKQDKGRPRKLQVNVEPVKKPIPEVKKYPPRRLPPSPIHSPEPPVLPFSTRRFLFQPNKLVAELPKANAKPKVTSTKSEEFNGRLRTLVKDFNLGPVHFSHNQIESGRFVASIKVGQEIFPTYPKNFDCLTDAYEYASKLAVEFFETKLPSWMIPA